MNRIAAQDLMYIKRRLRRASMIDLRCTCNCIAAPTKGSHMKTETLKIGGMTCGGCVGAVTKALRAVDGVTQVEISLNAGQAKVEFDERATSPDRLRAAIQRAGYEVDVSAPAQQRRGGCCG